MDRCKVKAVLDKPTWIEQHRRVYDTEYLSPTLFADAGGDDKSIKIAEPRCKVVGTLEGGKYENLHAYGVDGLSATITATDQGLNICEPTGIVLFQSEEFGGDRVNKENLSPTIKASKVDAGVIEPIVYDDYNQRVRADQSTIGTITTNIKQQANTLTTSCNQGVMNNYRIRKLTPKECFRLMGVHDDDFEKIAKNQSNSSLYHLAGDSIIVDVLMHIFGEMM